MSRVSSLSPDGVQESSGFVKSYGIECPGFVTLCHRVLAWSQLFRFVQMVASHTHHLDRGPACAPLMARNHSFSTHSSCQRAHFPRFASRNRTFFLTIPPSDLGLQSSLASSHTDRVVLEHAQRTMYSRSYKGVVEAGRGHRDQPYGYCAGLVWKVLVLELVASKGPDLAHEHW